MDDALAEEALGLVAEIREADGDFADKRRITSVIGKLTESSLDYYFVRTVRELGAGRAMTGVVTVANRCAVQAIRKGMQQVIGRFDQNQTLRMADYIEQAFYET